MVFVYVGKVRELTTCSHRIQRISGLHALEAGWDLRGGVVSFKSFVKRIG